MVLFDANNILDDPTYFYILNMIDKYIEKNPINESKGEINMSKLQESRYYLMPENDSADSFGNKAVVEINEDGTKTLVSYNTDVAKISADGETATVFGFFSVTTSRHINEFLKQNGFSAVNARDAKAGEVVLKKEDFNIIDVSKIKTEDINYLSLDDMFVEAISSNINVTVRNMVIDFCVNSLENSGEDGISTVIQYLTTLQDNPDTDYFCVEDECIPLNTIEDFQNVIDEYGYN